MKKKVFEAEIIDARQGLKKALSKKKMRRFLEKLDEISSLFKPKEEALVLLFRHIKKGRLVDSEGKRIDIDEFLERQVKAYKERVRQQLKKRNVGILENEFDGKEPNDESQFVSYSPPSGLDPFEESEAEYVLRIKLQMAINEEWNERRKK